MENIKNDPLPVGVNAINSVNVERGRAGCAYFREEVFELSMLQAQRCRKLQPALAGQPVRLQEEDRPIARRLLRLRV